MQQPSLILCWPRGRNYHYDEDTNIESVIVFWSLAVYLCLYLCVCLCVTQIAGCHAVSHTPQLETSTVERPHSLSL